MAKSLIVYSFVTIIVGFVPFIIGDFRPEGKARYILKGIGYFSIVMGVIVLGIGLSLLISIDPAQVQ